MRRVTYDYGKSLSLNLQLKLWQELIFNRDIKLNELTTNPLRDDKTASCCLFEDRRGLISLLDYGISAHLKVNNNDRLSLYEAIVIKYKRSADEVIHNYITLNKIENKIEDNIVKSRDSKTYLYFQKYKDENGNVLYTEEASRYYSTYGITIEDLLKTGVYSVQSYFISKIEDGERTTTTVKPYPELCLAMELQNSRMKIYYPKRENRKWYSNTTMSNYWFIKGSDKLVLCTSHKDMLVVHKLTGASVYSGMNETVSYSKEQKELINSYKHIYTLGDGDNAGKKFNERNIELFDANVIEISDYNGIINKEGKNCKDIAEIYRLDRKLCKDILYDGLCGDDKSGEGSKTLT